MGVTRLTREGDALGGRRRKQGCQPFRGRFVPVGQAAAVAGLDSDVFSLGTVLAFAATGTNPFSGVTITQGDAVYSVALAVVARRGGHSALLTRQSSLCPHNQRRTRPALLVRGKGLVRQALPGIGESAQVVHHSRAVFQGELGQQQFV